jgi:two-component system, NarL family, nitrate/nitrite response regulator NarL
LVREGLAALLGQVEELRLVAAGSRLDTAKLRKRNPQVLLLDLGLRNGDSFRLAEKVLKEFPQSKVIMMDVLPVAEEVHEFINLGVSGFIMKDASFDDVVDAIRKVVKGLQVLPPQMTGTLFSRIAAAAVVTSTKGAFNSVRMTPREREVVNLIAEGLANDEIAARLNIATYTVRSHVRNIMEKLMLHTRLQIAAYVHREGAATTEKRPSAQSNA